MNNFFATMLGGWEIILILAVVLILFGAKRIPDLAKGLGQGIREFKKASREVTEEIERAGDEPAQTPKAPPTNPTAQNKLPPAGPETKVL